MRTSYSPAMPRAAQDFAGAGQDDLGPWTTTRQHRAPNPTVRQARPLMRANVAERVPSIPPAARWPNPVLDLDPADLAIGKGIDRPYVNAPQNP